MYPGKSLWVSTHYVHSNTVFAVQLDAYQSAPYLLDLSLESLLHPVLAQLRKFVRRPLSTVQENLANPRVARVARLVYFYTKVRGAKTVCAFRNAS